MRKFKVTIDGKSYEVEVEEIKTGTGSSPRGITLERRSAERRAPEVTRPVGTNRKEVSRPESAGGEKPVSADGEKVTAPLPGTVSLVVSAGDQVAEGDVLFILEAMKMENEITAPVSGTVSSITVKEGATVDTGDVLAVIE